MFFTNCELPCVLLLFPPCSENIVQLNLTELCYACQAVHAAWLVFCSVVFESRECFLDPRMFMSAEDGYFPMHFACLASHLLFLTSEFAANM